MKKLLTAEEKTLFKSILGATQEGIIESFAKLLPSLYDEKEIIITKEYIIAKGQIPVGIVAHMDTVHKTPVVELFHDEEQNILWSPQGLGADDRAGVYGMIEILKQGYRPTLILTTDEEIGGLGASKLVGDYPEMPTELNYLIELDRRGSNDCVFYDGDNLEFEKYIENFGFKSDWGSFSDIAVLCPVWGIAGTNLSIGYYNEHTKAEYLNLDDMFNTLDRVCGILENVKEDDKFIYIPGPTCDFQRGAAWWEYSTNSSVSAKDIIGATYGYGDMSETDELCWGCLGTFDSSMIIDKGDEGTYCGDCYAKEYSTCVKCKEDFLDRDKKELCCKSCRKA